MNIIELEKLATELGARLSEHGWYLDTAESCTGGWIAEAVTAIAGSSAWFDRGFVTYSCRPPQSDAAGSTFCRGLAARQRQNPGA